MNTTTNIARWLVIVAPLVFATSGVRAEEVTLPRKTEPGKTYADSEFAMDMSKLDLSIEVDSPTYRPGDPIGLDIVLKNTSNMPFKIIFPYAVWGWPPTMSWGIRLTRTGRDPSVVLDIKPSGFYLGSYGGPPEFKTLHPKKDFNDSICLQYWLRHQRIWPLSEGTYEIALAFDSLQFPGIKAEDLQKTGLLTAPPIRFKVSGDVRKDPEELLALIGKKTNKRSLRSDLTSRRNAIKEEAWWIVYEYGDARLTPLLEKIAEHAYEQDDPLLVRVTGQEIVSKNLGGRNLRALAAGIGNTESSQKSIRQAPPAEADKPLLYYAIALFAIAALAAVIGFWAWKFSGDSNSGEARKGT